MSDLSKNDLRKNDLQENDLQKNALRQRLAVCFQAVFPKLKDEQIAAASVDSVAAWDSTAALMLANVIEQEMGVAVDYEALPELTSFQAMLAYVSRELQAKP